MQAGNLLDGDSQLRRQREGHEDDENTSLSTRLMSRRRTAQVNIKSRYHEGHDDDAMQTEMRNRRTSITTPQRSMQRSGLGRPRHSLPTSKVS